jgi:hypothetical protein
MNGYEEYHWKNIEEDEWTGILSQILKILFIACSPDADTGNYWSGPPFLKI